MLAPPAVAEVEPAWSAMERLWTAALTTALTTEPSKPTTCEILVLTPLVTRTQSPMATSTGSRALRG